MKRAMSPGGELWLLVFLFMFSCSILWPCCSATLMAGGAEVEKVVTHLPGFEGPLPFTLRTGYVEVDESNGVRFFYYFTPSERSPADDPLLLWFSGGPGCSSFNALIYEFGPLGFDLEASMDGRVLPKLVYRQESWTKVMNIIFLDSPAGSGFSYSVTKQGYLSSDTKAVNQIVTFLRKWFDKHPEYLSNPLYIGGDSYSGIIVPTVTSKLANGKQVAGEAALNLKGYLAGNPFVDVDNFDIPWRIPFAHRMGLISDEIYEEYKKSCSEGNISQRSIQCTNSLAAIHKCVKDIYVQNILDPNCDDYASPHASWPNLELKSGILEVWQQDHIHEVSTKCKRQAKYGLSKIWANDIGVREALGVHKGTVPLWIRCHKSIPYSRDITSSLQYHLDVTTKGYRSLVYSGDHDMAVPYVGTQSWIKSLNFPIVEDWRPWYVEEQVAGYTRSYSNNLTFATVKGAGHIAPMDNPRQCFAMISRWIAGDPL